MSSTRRLAAIMFTDVVGFTDGTQRDEEASLRRLSEEDRLVRPVVADHQGRVVKSTGDGLLVEFPSALKATECAVAIQQALRARNRGAAGPPIELRIGIHLGDVESRGDDILGDSVNIAARVQTAADVGGIAISQQVFDQVSNKLELRFEPKSTGPLKGVRAPLTIFRVLLPEAGSPGTLPPPSTEAGRLAVLPFANISPDPKDAFFSDGLTEEVIATLSDLRELRVIARTSVDQYRLTPRPVSQVAQELGVQWVLEGSVRKDGPRLRFTAQLIDARTQEHLWSGKYDRELVDIFALQSELAQQIAGALQLRLFRGDAPGRRAFRAPTPDSYLEYLEGRACLHSLSEQRLRSAKEHFERSLALDPQNAAAYAGLAEVTAFLAQVYRTMTSADVSRETRRLVDRALELDPNLAEAHTMLASDLGDQFDYVGAVRELELAIALNPSFPGAHLYYGAVLSDLRRTDEAFREYALAQQLDPLSSLPLSEEISLLTYLGRFEAARTRMERLGQLDSQGLLFHDRMGQLALATGDFPEWRRHLEWFESNFPDRPELPLARALYAALTDAPERARALVHGVETLPEATRPTGMIPTVYAALGDLDACFGWIDRAITEGKFAPRGWIYDVRREPVRRDPRFAEVLHRIHLD